MIFNFSTNAALSSAIMTASAAMTNAKIHDDELLVNEREGLIVAAVREARSQKSLLTINDIRRLFVPKKLEATYDSDEFLDKEDLMESLGNILSREEAPVISELQNKSPAMKDRDFEQYLAPHIFDAQNELGILSISSNPTADLLNGSMPLEVDDKKKVYNDDSDHRELNTDHCNGYHPAIGSGSGGYPDAYDFQTLIDRCVSVSGSCPYEGSLSCWDTSRVTDMRNAFERQYTFNNDISSWDTSAVNDMENMFYFASSFNQDIGSWETSNVSDFTSMFSLAFAFNQDLSGWDTSNATTMEHMFSFAKVFNQDVGQWDTSKVSNFGYMFESAEAFNRDISKWDTSKVTAMYYMFFRAFNFNQEIGVWDTSNVKTFSNMFRSATSFNQCLSSWAPQDSCVSTEGMFFDSGCPYPTFSSQACPYDARPWCQTSIHGCDVLSRCNGNYPIVGSGDIGYGTNFDFATLIDECLFGNCPYSGPLSCWDTSRVTDMSLAFYGMETFNDDISSWDTSAVRNMAGMFYYAKDFDKDLSAWNTSNVSDFSSMFEVAESFNGDVSTWDTSKATSMNSMFYIAKDFDQDIGSWITSKVSDFGYMFNGADSFNMDISNWDTSEAVEMGFMFASANNFNQDIDRWDTSKVQAMNNMFAVALRFNQNIASWDTSNVTTFRSMFRSAVSFNQCLSSWQPTTDCVDISLMFSNSGCPFNTPSPAFETCPNQEFNWCRGPEEECTVDCLDVDKRFQVKVRKQGGGWSRTTCKRVSKANKAVRRRTCQKKVKTRKSNQIVSDLCPYTCEKCELLI